MGPAMAAIRGEWPGWNVQARSGATVASHDSGQGDVALSPVPALGKSTLAFDSGDECGTNPISVRAARYSRRMSCPFASTVPLVGFTMPQMMLISVVLPAPLGPSSAKISPRRISKWMFLSACRPEA